ncbi:outer-membrane receptor for ferric coprogen and ferric-rhodotorulic acid [Pseudomonas cuatrocienegasensis]|uniref:Outer-membrane receptor for ferric coprogen and ferric-rhodotorulic acid n=1 Tax=Pseudomonas cuatrocienegasensis TaxID=543360 RepID=A0ABY1B9Y1_9PSED|nr:MULTISPECIES: TonB-dependent receptor [Pseudomonas]OEC35379.1 hypothetical protein A7D25_09690 [Pseudomonas sp. 21C1]SEQ34098.1 outer-membrane receptor for ferric coprogen and ferric-rhodotorulic acid [Pseudomonas cuatrocienegasensis]
MAAKKEWPFISCLLALAVAQAASFSSLATAEVAPASVNAKRVADEARDYTITSGSLGSALLQFGRQSGLQLLVPGELVLGLSSSGLKGSYTSDTALTALLQGTPLSFRFVGTDTVQVFAAGPKPDSAERVLGPVRVEGLSGAAGTQFRGGGNGSRDVTATEGSGSLNGPRLSVGSKGPSSIKDTPQSVSVITEERMKQQNIKTLGEAMEQATGITVLQGTGSLDQMFYSRGYEIKNIQIDGGSPFIVGAISSYRLRPNFDMSMYDHMELLRGSDGLFNGNGDAIGGSVNLVRKKPLDHAQTAITMQAGSWDNYRTSFDVSGPLGFDGRLRGRGVVTWQDRKYFYDIANDDTKLIYGTLEADLTDNTLFELGGSYSRMHATPWEGGLSMYGNGDDPELPRSTAWTYPWTHLNTETKEVFASLRQQLGDNADLSIKFTRLDQDNDTLSAFPDGSISRDGSGVYLTTYASKTNSTQDSLDINLNGHFEVFGLTQKVLLGGNYQKIKSYYTAPGNGRTSDIYPNGAPIVSVLPFDSSVPKPPIPADQYDDLQYNDLKQWGLYARVEITPWEPLHLITGWRLNRYLDRATLNAYDFSGPEMVITKEAIISSAREFERPYYAAVFDLAPEWSLYASYTDVYTPQLGSITLSGAPVAPLTGTSIEGGLKFASADGLLNASLSVYRNERIGTAVPVLYIDEQTGQLTDATIDLGGGRQGYFTNATSPDLSRGIDFEVTGQITPYWQASLGYSFNMNQQAGVTDPLQRGKPLHTQSPKHNLKVWNSFNLSGNEILDRTQLGIGVKAQSATYVAGGVFDDNFNYSEFNFEGKPYAVVSARAAYQIDDNWNVALNVENLFDKTYYQTVGQFSGGFWYGEPRNFMLSLTGSFD